MGRKSSEKAARRAKLQKEEEERESALIEASMGIPSIAELEIEKQKRETGQSASSPSPSTSGSTSARRGPSNKYSYDELKQLVESGEGEFGFRCFCNRVLNTEDVHESIVDDPQFRELYLHMNSTIRDKEQLELNDSEYLELAKSTNATGKIIQRYIEKKKNLQASGGKCSLIRIDFIFCFFGDCPRYL